MLNGVKVSQCILSVFASDRFIMASKDYTLRCLLDVFVCAVANCFLVQVIRIVIFSVICTIASINDAYKHDANKIIRLIFSLCIAVGFESREHTESNKF